MKVVCAGLSKTGTKSLHCALATLGLAVYDFPDAIYSHREFWTKVFEGNAKTDDVRAVLAGYDAAVDAPVNEYWEDILEAYPDAKVNRRSVIFKKNTKFVLWHLLVRNFHFTRAKEIR